MTTKIYHNPRCSKSRETLSLLESQGKKPEIIEYLNVPVDKVTLEKIALLLPHGAREMIRVKEAAKIGFHVEHMSEKEIIDLLAVNRSLMERPIVVTEKGARMGRPPAQVLDIL